nr:hypothetical protein [Tanacetum cinerariifolium]
MLCAYDCYVNIMWFDCTCVHRGAYDLGVATPRALVYAGVMTSEDARSCVLRIDVLRFAWTPAWAFGFDDNKRTRTGNTFAITINPVRREYNSPILKCVNCNLHHPPEMPCRACFNCGSPGHMEKDCRMGCGNTGNQARGRAFMLGADEALQDPNIMTGIKPSDLGFSYEIEIASGQLVEIDKVIKGCKLEIEGHVLDINLIPFGSRSFDVIIGMDWLSNHKAEIICHAKVVRIPLLDGKVLGVLGERPKEKAGHLMIIKAKEQKQEEMVVVRDFPE